MKSIRQPSDAHLDLAEEIVAPGGPVGVIAPTAASLQEVVCLLSGQKAGISRALVTSRAESSPAVNAVAMGAGLRTLQADPATEIVILVSQKLPAVEADSVLDLVRAADKPTVVCFVGDAPRRAWKAGAIPAARLDEAAMRAAAWVRGWDQALVSSWLEEEADELARLATGLLSRIGSPRTRVYGILACDVLAQEAALVLSPSGGSTVPGHELYVAPDSSVRTRYLHTALADPAVAVILVDLWVGDQSDPDPAGSLASLINGQSRVNPARTGPASGGPLIVAHVFGAGCRQARIGEQEASLREAGVIVARSNVSAAQLAGLIVAGAG